MPYLLLVPASTWGSWVIALNQLIKTIFFRHFNSVPKDIVSKKSLGPLQLPKLYGKTNQESANTKLAMTSAYYGNFKLSNYQRVSLKIKKWKFILPCIKTSMVCVKIKIYITFGLIKII